MFLQMLSFVNLLTYTRGRNIHEEKMMFNTISEIILLTVIMCASIIYIIWLIIFTVDLPVQLLLVFSAEVVSQTLFIAFL